MMKISKLPIMLSALAVAGGCSSGNVCCPKSDGNVFPAVRNVSYRTDAPALRFPVIIPIYGNDDTELSMTTD
ncbi:MAG: hypothetical protein J6S24_10090, partial [Lentisphaeria bacterium]|nr:hypothetical protein [Lentisphaeria bacterium]